jgi:hypothetical protein
MGLKEKPLKSIIEAEKALPTPAKWIITILIAGTIFSAFAWGAFVTSNPYSDRYPNEYNWWVDHERLHYPGVAISTAMVNTSCKQSGNIHPSYGENITQIQWLGGWDAGFVANLKIKVNETEVIIPTPQLGYCIYLYDAPREITVYGQDSTTGGWIKVGSRK